MKGFTYNIMTQNVNEYMSSTNARSFHRCRLGSILYGCSFRMKTLRFTTLPGDGIGPEVMKVALDVINALGQKYDFSTETSSHDVGGIGIDNHGEALPSSTLSEYPIHISFLVSPTSSATRSLNSSFGIVISRAPRESQ